MPRLKINVSMNDIMAACENDDYTGFCRVCGAEHSECEPDAREYECDEGCGKTVYGAEELLIMK